MRTKSFRRAAMVAAGIAGGASLLVTTAMPAYASGPGHYKGDGIYIRRCANTSCYADGMGYPSHHVTVYCYVNGQSISGDTIWLKHKDTTTGVSGYASEKWLDLVSGTAPHC